MVFSLKNLAWHYVTFRRKAWLFQESINFLSYVFESNHLFFEGVLGSLLCKMLESGSCDFLFRLYAWSPEWWLFRPATDSPSPKKVQLKRFDVHRCAILLQSWREARNKLHMCDDPKKWNRIMLWAKAQDTVWSYEIERVTAKIKEQGVFVAITCIASLFSEKKAKPRYDDCLKDYL